MFEADWLPSEYRLMTVKKTLLMSATETNLTHQKPVTLLTGFLGAGKTTLLNEYLEYRKGVRFAIIENEIGEQGIDGELVTQTEDTFVEMNNGCICCTLNDNFNEILKDLNERREQWDELGKFSV